MKKALAQSTTTKVGTQLEGIVVSDKMQQTAVVEVTRLVKHPKYQKFVKINKRFKAHNADNTYKLGDRVRLQSCRPLSKDKRFAIVAKIGTGRVATRVAGDEVPEVLPEA